MGWAYAAAAYWLLGQSQTCSVPVGTIPDLQPCLWDNPKPASTVSKGPLPRPEQQQPSAEPPQRCYAPCPSGKPRAQAAQNLRSVYAAFAVYNSLPKTVKR